MFFVRSLLLARIILKCKLSLVRNIASLNESHLSSSPSRIVHSYVYSLSLSLSCRPASSGMASQCAFFDLASEALEQDGEGKTGKGHVGVDRLVVCYVRDVEDAAHLRGKVIRGELDVECAVIDASMVPGVTCLLAAAMRARAHAVSSRLVTKTVHSELLLMLSAGRQISEAFKHFGIGDTSRNLLFASFTDAGGEMAVSDALAKVAEDIVRKPIVATDKIGQDINTTAICKVRISRVPAGTRTMNKDEADREDSVSILRSPFPFNQATMCVCVCAPTWCTPRSTD